MIAASRERRIFSCSSAFSHSIHHAVASFASAAFASSAAFGAPIGARGGDVSGGVADISPTTP